LNRKIVGSIVLAALLSVALVYALQNSVVYRVPSTGIVIASPNINLFYDSDCTIPHLNDTVDDWGNLSTGLNVKDWWIKNVGDCNITLSLIVGDVPSGWTLTWDYSGSILQPAEVICVTMQLTVPADAGKNTPVTWVYEIVANPLQV